MRGTKPWEVRNWAARQRWMARGRTQVVYEMWMRKEYLGTFDRLWRHIGG